MKSRFLLEIPLHSACKCFWQIRNSGSIRRKRGPSVLGNEVEPFIRLVPWRKDAFSLQTRWQSLHKTAGTAFLQSSRASPPSRLPLPLSFLLPTFRAPDKLASGNGRGRRRQGGGRSRGREVGGNKRRRNSLPQSNSLKCCYRLLPRSMIVSPHESSQ